MEFITNDSEAIRAIDEIKYRLKFLDKTRETPIADALNKYLDKIIEEFSLDGDPHAFASGPKEHGREG